MDLLLSTELMFYRRPINDAYYALRAIQKLTCSLELYSPYFHVFTLAYQGVYCTGTRTLAELHSGLQISSPGLSVDFHCLVWLRDLSVDLCQGNSAKSPDQACPVAIAIDNKPAVCKFWNIHPKIFRKTCIVNFAIILQNLKQFKILRILFLPVGVLLH